MRRFLLLLVVVFVVLLVVWRDRLYLRDPLGKVERNGVLVEGARVFIDFSNDVLVQEDGGRRMFLVRHVDRREAVPTGLSCVQGMACLTPADGAAEAIGGAGVATMSDREVVFTEGTGSGSGGRMRVVIR